MESVQQRMKRLGTHEKIVAFVQKQNQNYAFKRRYAVTRVKEFISECDKRGLNNHVSVGGLDSIILYLFINEVCHEDVPGVSASTLEDSSIKSVHKRLIEEGRITDKFEMPDSIIPSIYGVIDKAPDGTLRTTKAQRTGCSMCGFGIHMEKRPHRFDLLYEKNPKEWDYLMFHMCKDESGNDYGWAKVLDYIGVGWDPSIIGGNCKGQMSLPLDQMR